jgi:hypothetical protein
LEVSSPDFPIPSPENTEPPTLLQSAAAEHTPVPSPSAAEEEGPSLSVAPPSAATSHERFPCVPDVAFVCTGCLPGVAKSLRGDGVRKGARVTKVSKSTTESSRASPSPASLTPGRTGSSEEASGFRVAGNPGSAAGEGRGHRGDAPRRRMFLARRVCADDGVSYFRFCSRSAVLKIRRATCTLSEAAVKEWAKENLLPRTRDYLRSFAEGVGEGGDSFVMRAVN